MAINNRQAMTNRRNNDTLGGVTLTTLGFPDFYARIQALRFPISVAEVLEMRDLINHSADVYEEPADVPQNREFRETLEQTIHASGVENRHHCDRLLKVLGMLRSMHYQHSIASRDSELRLREAMAQNRIARTTSRRNGSVALVVVALSGLAWMMIDEAGWIFKVVPLLSILASFGYFHDIPRLERDMERLTQERNLLLRKRVESMDWRILTHKLALLLGYKQVQGIEVFQQQPETGPHTTTPQQ